VADVSIHLLEAIQRGERALAENPPVPVLPTAAPTAGD
jgi:hypothetical protein